MQFQQSFNDSASYTYLHIYMFADTCIATILVCTDQSYIMKTYNIYIYIYIYIQSRSHSKASKYKFNESHDDKNKSGVHIASFNVLIEYMCVNCGSANYSLLVSCVLYESVYMCMWTQACAYIHV